MINSDTSTKQDKSITRVVYNITQCRNEQPKQMAINPF